MSTYIYCVGQVKKAEEWYSIQLPYVEQNYTLFALLADVRNRNDQVPISKPRGVPTDFDEAKCHLSIGIPHSLLTVLCF